MRINMVLLILAATLFFSCGEKKNVTPNGYKITPYSSTNGQKPANGDMAYVHIYAYTDGKLLNSTRQNNRLLPVKIYSKDELLKMKESGQPNPVYEAVSMMAIGDSISIDIPITEEMKKNPQTANATEMHYDIVLVEAKTTAEMEAEKEAQRAVVEKISNQVKEMATQYTAGELNDKLTTTASGLKYMVLKEGNGPAPELNKTVQVNYYGALTNGARFDDSFTRGRPHSFPLGAGRVIKGWDEGIALLKKGSHAMLFIPPDLGYGKADKGSIPPDSELIFYVEVL